MSDPFCYLCFAATIFAYGQTISGKTFTIRGITESAVSDIYRHIENVSGIHPLMQKKLCNNTPIDATNLRNYGRLLSNMS